MIDRVCARALQRVLGVTPPVGAELAALARSRGRRADHALRLAALLFATSPLAPVLPYRVRRRAVDAMLDRVFRGPGELMLYAGLIGDLRDVPCGGLLPE
jgi:hypothetical protein